MKINTDSFEKYYSFWVSDNGKAVGNSVDILYKGANSEVYKMSWYYEPDQFGKYRKTNWKIIEKENLEKINFKRTSLREKSKVINRK